MDARKIISLWPTRKLLAVDLTDAGLVVTENAVHAWHRRNMIPGTFDCALVAVARKRGFALGFEDLARARSSVPVETLIGSGFPTSGAVAR